MKKMQLKLALLVLIDKGNIDYRVSDGGWTEYSIQYLLMSDSLKLAWTAGGTAGGKLTIGDLHTVDNGQPRWSVYNRPHGEAIDFDENYLKELVIKYASSTNTVS